MKATEFLPIVSVLSLVTVEFGGWALLGFLTGRGSLGDEPAVADHRLRFFRAGHAHAGVLIVLSLVYYLYLVRADFSNGFDRNDSAAWQTTSRPVEEVTSGGSDRVRSGSTIAWVGRR